MTPPIARRILAVSAATATLVLGAGIVAPEARALPPASATVSVDDLYLHAECTASGVGVLFTVTGSVTPRLPFSTASVECTLNGQRTLATAPTLNGLVGTLVPAYGALAPVLAPGPTHTAVGAAAVLEDQLTICVIADATLAPPLLPPIHDHVERCATS